MFVLVAVAAIWLGWNLRIVRKREETLKYLTVPSPGAASVFTDGDWPPQPWRSLPTTWRLLGAKPIARIILSDGKYTEEDRVRVQDLFPEASVKLDVPIRR